MENLHTEKRIILKWILKIHDGGKWSLDHRTLNGFVTNSMHRIYLKQLIHFMW